MILVEHPKEYGVFGSHGIGEPPMAPPAPTIAAARLQRRGRLDHRHADHAREGARGAEGRLRRGSRIDEEFRAVRADHGPQAVGLLNKFGATGKALGGGSDLVGGVMKDWVQGKGMPIPVQMVDLTTIPELQRHQGGRRRRAHRRDHHADRDRRAARSCSSSSRCCTQAALSVASPLIRNFGTLGGNINQRPRCWFFRGENFACYKKGGDFCYAVTGDNRYHAIIGGELCYIVHPVGYGDGAAGAERARRRWPGRAASARCPSTSTSIGPREDVLRENVLKPNEVMTEVFIPTPAAGTKMGWTKLKDRQVYDFAVVVGRRRRSRLDGANWKDGRVALGGVAPVPYRAKVVEDALKGKDIKATVKPAAAQIRTVARPMSLNAYKVEHRPGPGRADGSPGAGCRFRRRRGQRSSAPDSLPRSGAWRCMGGLASAQVALAAGPILQVTADGTSSVRPSWSPDGTRIAFQTSQDNHYRVYMMGADGTEPAAGQSGSASTIDIRPGARTARSWRSTTGTELKREIAILDLATSARTTDHHAGRVRQLPILESGRHQTELLHLPEGQPGHLDTVNTDGSKLVKMTQTLASENKSQCTFACHAATWSPDGSRLAYADGDQMRVFTMRSDDGTDQVKVSHDDPLAAAISRCT